MCACRLEQQKQAEQKMKAQYELEDYIFEMENSKFDAPVDPDDVYAQLAQKEKDLILAAELGKALLEKNEELGRANEKLAEEFSQKLEVLEQEKHSLKRRLDAAHSEYESKTQELQNDIIELRQILDDQQLHSKDVDRDRQSLIAELTDQNHRLTNKLKETTRNEEHLTAQVQALRDQFHLRKSNLQDHVSHLELLRDEINLLTDKKLDLERRIHSLMEEREGLSSTLDESADRILMLERETRERDVQLRHNRRELAEMRAVNVSLTDRLEMLSRSVSSAAPSSSSTTGHHSLLNEMEMSANGVSSGGASNASSHLPEEQEDDDATEEIECDDVLLDPIFPDREELRMLKHEILSAYQQARSLCEQLRHVRRRDSTASTNSAVASSEDDSLTLTDVKVGLLSGVIHELKGLVHEALRREARSGGTGACRSCGRHPAEVQELEVALHCAREAGETVARQLADKNEELRKKNEETLQLQSKLSVRETELASAVEERDTLRSDLAHSGMARDELIKKAWETRDQAMQRKNACEIELARTRVEVMQANSQLMEVVQQKIELSQQLEQWQVDMQVLLDEQMRRKLTSQENKARTARSKSGSDSDYSSSGEKRKNSRLFGLFQR